MQRTILDECWRPAFARYLIQIHGLRLDLELYLVYYNEDRAHTWAANQLQGFRVRARQGEDVVALVRKGRYIRLSPGGRPQATSLRR
jgi:hypothetical protein